MPEHRDVRPKMERGRETWKFTAEEIISILRRETGCGEGKFYLWGLDPSSESIVTLVRDYQQDTD